MSRMLRPLALGVLAATASAAPLHAQGTEVAFDFGASTIGSASNVNLGSARFGMGGIRISNYDAGGSGIFASLLGGTVLGDTTGGNFISGMIEATAVEHWTANASGSLDIKILGFGVREPFPYRTLATELGSTLRLRGQNTSLRIRALGSLGNSRIELFQTVGGPTRTFEGDHWRVGSTGEFLVGSPNIQVGVAGGAHRASGGTYSSAGGRLIFGGDWGVVEVRADRWGTPEGPEVTGGISFAVPLGGGFDFRGFFGRSDPDPLTLAQPGGESAGALIGWTIVSPDSDNGSDSGGPLAVVTYGETSSRVRMEIDAPASATNVVLVGDFTLWEPRAMTREGDRWVIEIDVPVGTHHYGFLADDEWYLPDDIPNVVPDEWGRETATLVIEGAAS